MSDSVDDLFKRYGPGYRWLVIFTGMTGVIAMVLSATIANVAVPSVMGAFGVGQDQAQWMATAFIATMTAGQLLSAYIIAAFGHRNGFLMLIVIFFIGTMIAVTSTNIMTLALGRSIQGVCAGAVQPLVLVTIFGVFGPNQRGTAMGIFGMAIMLAPGLGPVVGGIAIDHLSWRHIFLIPLPLCLIAFVLGSFFMPGKTDNKKAPPFDFVSLTLLLIGLFSVLSYIANGQRFGWVSNQSLLTLLVGLIMLVSFVAMQLKAPEPLLDLSLFTNAQFTSAVAVGVVFGAGNFGVSYAVPVFVQTVQGFTATKAGFVLVPAGIMLMCMFSFTGKLADRVPNHLMIICGLVTFATGALLMMGADVNTPFFSVVIFVMIGRFGQALILPAMNASALRSMPPDKLNRASGGINFMRQFGGALGINGLVAFMEQRTLMHSESLAATQTAGNAASRELLENVRGLLNESGVPEAAHSSGALHYLGQVVQAQANTLGFQDGFMILAVIFLMAMVPAYILGKSRTTKV